MSDATNKTKIVLWSGKRVALALAWFDLWVGFYVDPEARILYWCPVPCVVIAFKWGPVQVPHGTPGVRDPDNPCEVYTPGIPGEGDCMSDGHYLCLECSERVEVENDD